MNTKHPETDHDYSPALRERIDISNDLTLRLPQETDAPQILEIARQNHEDLQLWFPWVGDVIDLETAKDYVTKRQEGFKSKDLLPYVIENKEGVVGAISARITWQHKRANIGYWLKKEARGQGIAADALQSLVDYCFSDLKLNRLELDISQDNHNSVAVATQVGFTHEGTRKDWWFDGQKFLGASIYRLLSDEWSAN